MGIVVRKFYKNYLENNTFFIFFSVSALLLLVAGFVAPPLGDISNNVLIAVGEINGTLAIGAVIKAIDNGGSATFQHNNTTVTITNNEDEEDE